MSTEQNKEIVRRFVTEALSGRNVSLADEVLAPNYVNRIDRCRPGGLQGDAHRHEHGSQRRSV